jgi:hypothetical protein
MRISHARDRRSGVSAATSAARPVDLTSLRMPVSCMRLVATQRRSSEAARCSAWNSSVVSLKRVEIMARGAADGSKASGTRDGNG